jgi:hypothetical protein
MSSRWSRTTVSLILLALPWVSGARADDAPSGSFRLIWVRGDRTESCADQGSIAEGVTRRVGRQVLSESARRSVEGFVVHEGDSWEAHIYVRDENGRLKGSRVLTSQDPSCDAIQSAATLAIALAIDPDAALRAPPASSSPAGAPSVDAVAVTAGRPSAAPSPPSAPPPAAASPTTSPPAAASPATSPPAPPSPATPPSAPPSPATPPPAPLPPVPAVASSPVERSPAPKPPPPEQPSAAGSASAALRAVGAFGLLPSTAPGVAFSAEVRLYRWLRAAGGVLYLPEQPTADHGFAFGLTAARLGACAQAMETSRVDLSVCADVLAGAIHSVVFALEPVHPGDRAWAGGALGGVLHVHLAGPVEGQIGADLVVPFTRNAFAVQGQAAPVFQEAPVTAVFFAGVGLSIP